ncbi:hypothetical protein PCCS19_09830 [Paenibacillus sp. CCS19]|uniref:hypothetical protein n=1 Tax=Paenibacillus sp. CCS19 TaxID=3158387 RepID=UPI002567F87E|nr:hypothetical protein [Paenibacillus cellulosilyticus]GMK37929.1 hypothetical protein PCCS19_09830 [Paenibacillus cellulosilyticus]
MASSEQEQILVMQRRMFGLRNIDGQIYDSFDKPDTVLNGTKTLSGHNWAVSGNGIMTAKIKNGELIADGLNFYASVDYGKPIPYMQAAFSFTKVDGQTSGISDNIVMILQGGALNLGTMIHMLIGKTSFTLMKRVNDGNFIVVPVTKMSEGINNFRKDGFPYSMELQLEGNVLTITNGTDIYKATDDSFVTINPSRATIQIAPQPNAQFIGKFHSIAVGEKASDNDLVSKNGLIKSELIPIVDDVLENAPQIIAFNDYAANIPNWINITHPPYNAAPNSDIATVLQSVINSLSRGTIFIPDGDYLISQTIKLKPKVSFICGSNTVFKPSTAADNFNMFEFPKYQVRNDKTTFTGLRINGLNKNVTGLKVFNAINLYFYDCTIENCQDTGLELNQSQFNQFYNLVLFNNKIGLHINAGTGSQTYTGGNSNTFYSLTLASNIVGALVHHVSGNYFYSTIPLANRVSCFAFFDCLTNYIHGGCPETTGVDAPNTVSIDLKGKTVKKSTIYCSNSILSVDSLQNNDASVRPSILLENESLLDYINPRGYGQPYYSHVACDSTSSVSLVGKFDAVGNFENVTAIPSGLIIRTRNGFLMKDNTKYDKYMTNSSVSPLAPPIVKLGTGGVVSVSSKNDVELGSVKAVKFSNSVTVGTDKAVIYAANIFPNGIGKKYSGMAVNLKADADTSIKVELGEPNGAAMDVRLKAGEWRRVCLLCTALPNYNVFFCPLDNAGAELLVTRLCSINTNNEQTVRKLLDGYFNDNSSS